MREATYTVYASGEDMTFIMKDCYVGDECKSTEVIGFYYGEPNTAATAEFTGKLKAEFDM